MPPSGQNGGPERPRSPRGARPAFARRSSRRGSAKRFALALAAAALAHVGLVGLLASWHPWESGARESSASASTGEAGGAPIELRDVDEAPDPAKVLEALSRPDPPAPDEKKAEEEKRREAEDKDAKGQVVDIARPEIEAHPDQAKYLAEFDSRVAHETRGHVGTDRAGAPKAVAGAESEPSPPSRPQPAGNPDARPGLPGPRHRSRDVGVTGPRGEDGVTEQIGPDGRDARPGSRGRPGSLPRPQRPSLGEDGTGGTPGTPHPNLHPTEQMLARAITSGQGSPDFIDADDGESTALNAKKFKYASFFNRVKRDVAQKWNPSAIYVRHDPTGNVYGVKDRVTQVRVNLHPDGTIASVDLVSSSGVGFLDDEAIDAFRRAAPFVNPPPQLVDGDGEIHFNFGFIFELSGHTSTKVFRYD